METISISRLKARLSSELKKVKQGTRIVVLDHNHPVAELVPVLDAEPLLSNKRTLTGQILYSPFKKLILGHRDNKLSL